MPASSSRPPFRWPSLRRGVRSGAPASFWVAPVVLAVVTTLVVLQFLGRAEAAYEAYGTTRRVAVVDRPVAAGEPVADAVRWAELPAAVVPATATTVLDPAGVAAVDLVAGEILVDARLAPPGPAAMLAEGQLGLAVARTARVPDVAVGDRVAVVAPADPLLGLDDLRVGGVIVAADDVGVVVAVPAETAPAVAAALAAGTATVALAP